MVQRLADAAEIPTKRQQDPKLTDFDENRRTTPRAKKVVEKARDSSLRGSGREDKKRLKTEDIPGGKKGAPAACGR